MYIEKYNRQKAIEYAKKWAFKRNPNYYNFDSYTLQAFFDSSPPAHPLIVPVPHRYR